MSTPVEEAMATMPAQMRWLGLVLLGVAALLSTVAYGAI